jgi:Flp pilus assembly protein TadD
MKCYNCGCRLSEKDFCTNCGADVSRYKKILYASNRFFNEGLEKANVRDLSGAIVSLRQSLKFNKNNIEARNLLGLVYFEMGEVVAALSEWVISKNLKAAKNIADDYITMVQANPTRLESINQTIKKYNLALNYCRQDSNDLAIIQLKKVLSLNPKFIRAHQLLALIYMNMEDWEKAKKELVKCNGIDSNNLTTLRYMKIIDNAQEVTEDLKIGIKKKKQDETQTYQNGNDIIIQPLNPREPIGFSTIINIVIGIVLGLMVGIFLILPGRIQSAKAEMKKELIAIGEESDAKSITINDLEQDIKALTTENATLKGQVENYEGTDGIMAADAILFDAVALYFANKEDVVAISEVLENMDTSLLEEAASESFLKVYQMIVDDIGPKVADRYYDVGYTAYNNGQFEEAIANFSKAVEYDSENVEALYNLGNAYRKNENVQEAVATYTLLIQLFPTSSRASKAQGYIDSLQ